MLFKNILVPFDNSSFSKRAFNLALDIAQKYDSTINVVSCIDLLTTKWIDKTTYENALLKQAHKQLLKEIIPLQTKAQKKGISFKHKIMESSSIGRTLLSFAKTKNIDLIIIGSHGKGFFDRLVLGSVSNRIIQQSNCPVLVVK
ncbi:MAG: universal stress protein [Nitrosopumilus sp.]